MANKNDFPAPQPERPSERPQPTATSPTGESLDEGLLEAAELLIWALLDDEISASQCSQLERLILDHEQVRQRYLECAQLHIELRSLHAQEAKKSSDLPESPILGLLNIDQPVFFPNAETSPPLG